MAAETTDERLVRLEAELAVIRGVIASQQAVKEMEEGGAGARFRTSFTPIETLYKQAKDLEIQLQTLYSYTARR